LRKQVPRFVAKWEELTDFLGLLFAEGNRLRRHDGGAGLGGIGRTRWSGRRVAFRRLQQGRLARELGRAFGGGHDLHLGGGRERGKIVAWLLGHGARLLG